MFTLTHEFLELCSFASLKLLSLQCTTSVDLEVCEDQVPYAVLSKAQHGIKAEQTQSVPCRD